MILLGKDEIEQLVDRDEMMDEIERAYQIIRDGRLLCAQPAFGGA